MSSRKWRPFCLGLPVSHPHHQYNTMYSPPQQWVRSVTLNIYHFYEPTSQFQTPDWCPDEIKIVMTFKILMLPFVCEHYTVQGHTLWSLSFKEFTKKAPHSSPIKLKLFIQILIYQRYLISRLTGELWGVFGKLKSEQSYNFVVIISCTISIMSYSTIMNGSIL